MPVYHALRVFAVIGVQVIEVKINAERELRKRFHQFAFEIQSRIATLEVGHELHGPTVLQRDLDEPRSVLPQLVNHVCDVIVQTAIAFKPGVERPTATFSLLLRTWIDFAL